MQQIYIANNIAHNCHIIVEGVNVSLPKLWHVNILFCILPQDFSQKMITCSAKTVRFWTFWHNKISTGHFGTT